MTENITPSLVAKEIPASRYEEVRHLANDLLDDHGGQLFDECVRKNPELAIFYESDAGIQGICFGMARNAHPGEVILQGIAINRSTVARGLGSMLLADFESLVKSHGYNKVSLGSAADYVEHFYIKNGYVPTEYLIYLDPSQRDRLAGLNVLRERQEGSQLLVNMRITGEYSVSKKHELAKQVSASDVSVIFEKQLA